MKFRSYDYEIPQMAIHCGFNDLSDPVDQCAFMINSDLRLGLWVRPVNAGMKRFTVTAIDRDGQNLTDGGVLLETDDEEWLARFVAISRFAEEGAQAAIDSRDAESFGMASALQAWDFLTLNRDKEDWPIGVPCVVSQAFDGYRMPDEFALEYNRHLAIKGAKPHA